MTEEDQRELENELSRLLLSGALQPGDRVRVDYDDVELSFDVAPPVWLEPGEWWALVRVGCAGRLVYSPAVKVTVR